MRAEFGAAKIAQKQVAGHCLETQALCCGPTCLATAVLQEIDEPVQRVVVIDHRAPGLPVGGASLSPLMGMVLERPGLGEQRSHCTLALDQAFPTCRAEHRHTHAEVRGRQSALVAS